MKYIKKFDRSILMKISTHIFYITYKIVYEFGTDTYRAVLEKLRFEEKVKKILNLKYL